MKRKFTKIMAALALLTFLIPMTGWGQTTYTLTIETSDFNTTSYAANNGSHTKDAVEVGNSSNTMQIGWYSNQVMQSSNVMQWKKNEGYIYNTTDLGTINSVTINSSAGSFTTYYGTSYHPTSGTTVGNGYFTTKVGNATGKTTSVVINFTISGTPQPTTYTVTYNGNGNNSGSVPTDNNQYTSGQSVTVLGNTGNLAKTGYTFDGWNTAADGSGTDYDAGDSFQISANTTLYAQWTQTGGGSTAAVTYDFTDVANFLTTYPGNTNPTVGATINNFYSLTGDHFVAAGNDNCKFISYQGSVYFILGKSGATLQLPAFSFDVERIEITGRSGASSSVKQNIYVNGTAVSTETTGATGTNTYNIAAGYQTAGTIYTLQVTSAHNTQITEIKVYEKQSGGTSNPTIVFSPNSIDLGNVAVGQQIQETFSVAQADLTAGITLSSGNVGTLSTYSINQGAAATQVTWTYTPTTAGAIYATITATSGTLTETLTITGTAKTPHSVTINSMLNGGVATDIASAIEGATITLTATPDAGFYLYSIDATGQTSQATPTGGLTLHTNGNFTFTMPDENVNVGAMFNQVSTMTVTEALAATLPLNHYVCVTGIVSGFYGNNSSVMDDNSHRYYISLDGTSASQLLVYNGTGLNHAAFSNANDVQIGDQVVIWGGLVDYTDQNQNTIREIAKGNYIISQQHPASIVVNPATISLDADDMDGTTGITFTNLVINQSWEDCFVTFYTNANGTTVATQPDWVIDAVVAEENNAYVVSCAVDANEGPARTAYFKVYAYDANQNAVYSNMVTLTQAAVCAPAPTTGGWVLTNLADLAAGDVFVIVSIDENDAAYAMSNDQGTQDAPTAVSVTINGNELTGTIPANIQWNISGDATNGYTFYPDGDNTTWLYNTGSNAKCLVGTNVNSTYVFDNTYGYLKHVGTDKYIGVYNSQNWRGYVLSSGSIHSNISGQTFGFYKYTNVATETLTIQPYSGDGGYYLIASPFNGVEPTAANGFLTNSYDLYSFDQAKEEEWRNYETTPFYLLSGKGYLYANSGNNGNATTLTFTGVPYDGNGQITLSMVNGADFSGWNLIGNPYANAAILKDANNGNKAFYTLNGAGSELEAPTPGTAIAAMQGVFVEAANNGEVVTFVEQQPAPAPVNSNYISLNVSRNRGGVIDRALIGIGEGPMLHKFQLNPNNTKIYITEANQDYAIVRSSSEAEVPVSFRASENGSYTISVDAENMEMTYLHLIDNMTGADVDLLATPSYTFEAKTTDYASRFRLVFSAEENGASTGSATFAFFNGSEWTISNIGEATLQVVDVMGRILSTETVNGNATISLNQVPGVYMLRLVNGNNVRTQKVVVR